MALLFPGRLGGVASIAEFRGLRTRMGSKLSTSLVSLLRGGILRNELDKAVGTRERYSQKGYKEELDQRIELLKPKIASENVKDTFMIMNDETWQSLVIETDGPVMGSRFGFHGVDPAE
ncbi:hypothetical protein SADUNF_Sadunf13G0103800 [Salix dunnii]|uniref:Uncharacterized protein n=1 Tax=Salix dunnii TaxID=1413687 RepID=A0A835MM73_9ROSI|nr:hypothetical protein SADUNF_Sadunf13G0103800 [Salix dunnii]